MDRDDAVAFLRELIRLDTVNPPDEHVSIPQWLTAIRVYTRLAQRLLG